MLFWALRPLAAILLWVKIWVKEIAAFREHRRPVNYVRMPRYPAAWVSKNKRKITNYRAERIRAKEVIFDGIIR